MKAVTVDSTAGGTELSPAGNRDFLHIFNNGSQTLYIQYDGDSTNVLSDANGWPVPAGDYYALDNDGNRNVFNKQVLGFVPSGSVEVRIQGDD
jgi:hypothetical protein